LVVSIVALKNTQGGNMRRLICAAFFIVLALFASSSEGESQTIKVGAVVPLTGRYAALGAKKCRSS
jgi:ABC-type branched-subunit amino acid transport system substrate-binding protein